MRSTGCMYSPGSEGPTHSVNGSLRRKSRLRPFRMGHPRRQVGTSGRLRLAIEAMLPKFTVAAPVLNDYYDHSDHLAGEATVSTDLWTVAEAKAKLSRLIENAQKHGPQTITRNGRRAAVVVDAEEWDRKTQRSGTLADFFSASPLRGSSVKFRRVKDRPRPTGL